MATSWDEDPDAFVDQVLYPVFSDRLHSVSTRTKRPGIYTIEGLVRPKILADRPVLYEHELSDEQKEDLEQQITVERTQPFSDDRYRLAVHSIQPLVDESDDRYEKTLELSGFARSMRDELTGLNGITRIKKRDEKRLMDDSVLDSVLGPPDDVRSAINEHARLFDAHPIEKPTQEKIDCSTRENGSVGDEEYSEHDREAARSVRDDLKDELGDRIETDIATIDEWVHLDVSYSPALDQIEQNHSNSPGIDLELGP